MLKQKYMFINVKDFWILLYSLYTRKNLKNKPETTLKFYVKTLKQCYNIT
jgi:hypothetical protein